MNELINLSPFNYYLPGACVIARVQTQAWKTIGHLPSNCGTLFCRRSPGSGGTSSYLPCGVDFLQFFITLLNRYYNKYVRVNFDVTILYIPPLTLLQLTTDSITVVFLSRWGNFILEAFPGDWLIWFDMIIININSSLNQ